MRGSQSRRAGDDVALATRRERAGHTFASVRHALRFFFERGSAMQAALGQHPRGETAPDGSQVFVDVDGGRGGDLDELLATLQTIHQAMGELRRAHPVRHDLLVLYVRDGVSMEELGKRSKRATSTVSAELGRAEAFLVGWLVHAEVVVPRG